MIAGLNKDEKRSIGITAVIVVLLTTVFFFVGLKLELPLPKGELEISFGTSNEGSGEVQPEEFTSEEITPVQTEVVESQSSEASDSPSLTSNDNIVQAEVVEEKKEEKTPEEPKEEAVEEVDSQTDAETDMLTDLFAQSSSSQESEGETSKEGDQGDPNGGQNNNHNTGFWDGDSYFYGGPKRGNAYIPTKRETDCREQGKVGVIIYVNREGRVIGTPKFTNEGTTNPAPCLVEKAINWAKGIRYEANPAAPVQQKIRKICNFDYKE